MNVTDYREVLKNQLLERKRRYPGRFTYQKMAEACRVQKTYLSRVIKEEAHLSRDQLYLAIEFLGLKEKQSEYLFVLHDYSRAGLEERRVLLRKRLKSLGSVFSTSSSVLEAKPVDTESEDWTEYYLDPYVQIVHMLLTLKRFAQKPKLIAEKLDLPQNRVGQILETLSRLGVIQWEKKEIRVLREKIHLPAQSKLYESYRLLQRLKTLEQIGKVEKQDGYNFSVLFSSDRETREEIHKKFLNFLQETEKMVGRSNSEHVYQLNFDLFPWA